jgi:hypothetical protein
MSLWGNPGGLAVKCYRVVIFDENQKVLISKVVTAEEETTMGAIAERMRIIVNMHKAPFTVSVAEYVHDSMTIFEMMQYLNTALNEMSLWHTD